MKGYPKWFSLFFISSVLGFLFFSGIMLSPTTLALRFNIDDLWRLSGFQYNLVALIHVLVGLVVLAVFGALWSLHMRLEWRQNQKRISGSLLVLGMAFLGISGICIYYVTNEFWLMLTSTSHLIVGILLFLIYVFHSVFQKAK